MPGFERDVLGGEGGESVEEEANSFPSTDFRLPLRLDDRLQNDRPPDKNEENFQSPTLIGSNFIQGPGWLRNEELKVKCVNSDYPIIMAGAQREPSADVFLKLDCTGDTKSIKVKVSIDQIDLFMFNSCTNNCPILDRPCGPGCKTAFIHQVTIEIRPKWPEVYCRRMNLQPYHIAQEFGLQRTCGTNIQMALNPKNSSASVQRSNMISQTDPAFGFSPARRYGQTGSINWRVRRYGNGTKLELDKPRWGDRPELPIPTHHMPIHRDSFRAEVEWELEPQAELHPKLKLERLEFDWKIHLHTALLKRKRRCPSAYVVTTGPIVPFDSVLTFNNQ